MVEIKHIPKTKNVFKQLVDAAVTMHAANVFHRDIKMENVLIETSSKVPRVWIIDLGNGCLKTSSVYKNFFGTTELAPPELAARGEYKADPTTVWQLGTVLYEIVVILNRRNSSCIDKLMQGSLIPVKNF
ncbi:serine/threonine-protein kinase pim-2-like [Syngnathoides biaculeatus]|uniref:serine/threonine-protein kinase pim-2-like n=1 Tax=Syngnathoides biaculeatus TaxID=300417 RepID=UPI002ADE6E75|nr:serine/threonine-protein kinase pim-2-like [Syngnathoides biaculeatus]